MATTGPKYFITVPSAKHLGSEQCHLAVLKSDLFVASSTTQRLVLLKYLTRQRPLHLSPWSSDSMSQRLLRSSDQPTTAIRSSQLSGHHQLHQPAPYHPAYSDCLAAQYSNHELPEDLYLSSLFS